MTWSLVWQLCAAAFAICVFIDKYHRARRESTRIIEWVRDKLTRVFIALDEMKPVSIAGNLIGGRRLLFLGFFGIPIALTVIFGFLGIVYAWALSVADSQADLPGTDLFVLTVMSTVIQVCFAVLCRFVARRFNDAIALLVLLLIPAAVLIWGLRAMDQISAQLPTDARGDLTFQLVVAFEGGMIPSFLVTLLLGPLLFLKGAALVTRRVLLVVTNGASDPRTDPFTYFGGLASVAALAVAALAKEAKFLLLFVKYALAAVVWLLRGAWW